MGFTLTHFSREGADARKVMFSGPNDISGIWVWEVMEGKSDDLSFTVERD